MTWTVQRLRHVMCGLRGHESVMHFEPHRLSLRCLRCGHETPGWMLRPETGQADTPADVFPHHFLARLRPSHSILQSVDRAPLTRGVHRSGHAAA
jgi:hypothetical protein